MSKRKNLVFIFLSCLVIYLTAAFTGEAQKRTGLATEGIGVDNIVVGQSTRDDVLASYGSDYELVEYEKYSHAMTYKKLGLAFYYCQADPRREIFVVNVKPPYYAMTAKGIILGESTRQDVIRFYLADEVPDEDKEIVTDDENPNLDGLSETEFKGIQFYFGKKKNHATEVVNEIDIFETDGLRQCDSKFGKL